MANSEIQNELLRAAMAGGITSHKELAVFMGQIQAETHFTQAKEDMGKYTAQNVLHLWGPHPDKHGVVHEGRVKDINDANELVKAGPNALAERVYGGRMGNSESGDAFKYTGRGFIQLTGKANYEHYGKLTGLDLVIHPELANDKAKAAKIAVAYWNETVRQNGKPQEDVAAATQRVNGGLQDLGNRRRATQEWEEKFKREYTSNVTYGQDSPSERRQPAPVTTPTAAASTPATANSIADKNHPGHSLYTQALAGLEKFNAAHGIPSDQRTQNAAAAVAVEAHYHGLKRIDHVEPNATGDTLLAVQGKPGTAHSKVIHVPTVNALSTPIEDSSKVYLQPVHQVAPQQGQQAHHAQDKPQPAMVHH